MGKTMRSYADQRLQQNMMEYFFYEKRLKRLLLSMFDWENLPDGISERFIESQLYQHGILIFFKSKKLGFHMVARATAEGVNNYDEPIAYTARTSNGFQERVLAENCVPIWNDYFREGNSLNVNFFAKKLSKIEKTIDINLENITQPTIVSCSEGQLETVKAVLEKKTLGIPVIPVSEEFNEAVNFKVWDTGAKNYIPDLMDTKHEYMNEALTFFGINNVNVVKRERLVTGEAEQNDEQIFLNRNTMLKARLEAVTKINEMFDTNIKVSLSKNIETEISKLIGEKKGENDG